MTHSLHRIGSVEELENDYVVLAMGALGFNKEEAGEKLRVILKILFEHEPINIGDAAYGSLLGGRTKEDFFSDKIPKVISAVFKDKNTVKKILKEIKKEKLGVSVVVSGIIKEIEEIVQETGLEMHAVNLSAGYFGKTEKVAQEDILKFTSMCGHHLISPNLVIDVLDKYKNKKLSLDEAAKRLAKPCICGLFNIEMAKKLIINMQKEGKVQ